MLVIKNINKLVGQKIRIGSDIWVITKANEYSHTYTFHISNNITMTDSIELCRTTLCFSYKGSITGGWNEADMKTMWVFVRVLHRIVNG
jgi:hypothetical protein